MSGKDSGIESISGGLEEAGLKRTLAQVYIALLASGQSSATYLAKTAGIHRVDIYRRLKELMQQGMVSIKLGRPTLYQAADPRSALDSLIENRRNALERVVKEKAELERRLRKIAASKPSFVENKQFTYELVIGRRQGYSAVRQMLRSANTGVQRIISANGLRRNYTYKVLDEYLECKKRGARVRIITDVTHTPKKIARFCSRNFELRHSKESSMRLLIVDERMMMLSGVFNDAEMSLDSTADRYLLVKDEDFARILSLMFEHVWSSATDVKRKFVGRNCYNLPIYRVRNQPP